jgi:hypothetical protein
MSDFDFTPRMVGDAVMFDRGGADVEAAEKLFTNQGLHAGARAFALSHPRAIQYLEQAPVLAFAAMFGGPGVRRVNALYMNHKVTPLCEQGVKLSELMRSFGLPLPLRRIKASILCPKLKDAVRALSAMPPEVLGRIIPEKPGQQRRWLLGLAMWRSRLAQKSRSPDHLFEWAAEAGSRTSPQIRDYGDLVDFAASGEPFNTAWGWPRAKEEAELWHDRLDGDRIARQLKIKPDFQIDLGYHPDVETCADLTFVAMRTPKAITTEGRTMRHCVASYIPNVMHGDCHIVSVRSGREHVATLELDRAWTVRQLKGKYNAAPTAATRAASELYAAGIRRMQRDGLMDPRRRA